jgi:hypothetical protein
MHYYEIMFERNSFNFFHIANKFFLKNSKYEKSKIKFCEPF